MATRRIAGKEFLGWLRNAGIIPERTSRVVIDAGADGAVLMYITMYGDESLLSVKPPPALGVEIKVVGPASKEGILSTLRLAGMPATSKPYKLALRVDDEWVEAAEDTQGSIH